MEDKQTVITRRNILIVLLVALVICIAVLAVIIAVDNTNKSISVTETPNCSTSAIIRCGSSSTSALKTAYSKSTNAKNVYGYFGITSSKINNLNKTAVAGSVSPKGDIYIGGDNTPVATNALVAVQTSKGATGGIDYKGSYFALQSPSEFFTSSSEAAFVITKNNVFEYAIIASGDNPVIGTNITGDISKTPTIASSKASSTSSSASSSSASSTSSTTSSKTSSAATSSPAASVTATSPATTTAAAAAAKPLSSTGPSTDISIALFSAMTVFGTMLYRRRIVKRLDS